MYKRDKTIWCLTEEVEVNFVVINEQTSKRLFEKESTPDLSKGSQGFSNKALRVSPLLETLIFFFFSLTVLACIPDIMEWLISSGYTHRLAHISIYEK